MRCRGGKAEMGDIVRWPDGHVNVARPWPHGAFLVVADTNGYYAVRGDLKDVKVATRAEAIRAGLDPDAPRP